MVHAWLTVHQEKYTTQKLHLLEPIMTLDFILDHFVLNHAPVSYITCNKSSITLTSCDVCGIN